MNNTFGNILRLTIFGASHAPEVGVIMEGVPAGIRLTPKIFSKDIDRRRPALTGETTRHEDDIPAIEGLDADGFTTNNPIRISFHNSNTRSKDYSHLVTHPRPSHADLVQRRKYGADYDLAGGGIASGRMTIALVAAGVVAKRIIDSVSFDTRLVEVGGSDNTADFEAIIAEASRAGDSVLLHQLQTQGTSNGQR